MASASGWTAGVVHHGPPAPERHDNPLSHIVAAYTSRDTYDCHTATAQEAFDQRRAVLKEGGTIHHADPKTLTIRYHNPATECDVTLEYKDGPL